MKKVVLMLLLFIFLVGCSPTPDQIRKEIDQANYCNTKEDCRDAGDLCPYGCNIYVNKDKVGKIMNLLDSVDVACMYGCVECPDVECKESKCEPVCAGERSPEAPSEEK
ncbi:MAG: hypothetical protein V1729_04225 [Candidatus Woesearchaeota archaeon]